MTHVHLPAAAGCKLNLLSLIDRRRERARLASASAALHGAAARPFQRAEARLRASTRSTLVAAAPEDDRRRRRRRRQPARDHAACGGARRQSDAARAGGARGLVRFAGGRVRRPRRRGVAVLAMSSYCKEARSRRSVPTRARPGSTRQSRASRSTTSGEATCCPASRTRTYTCTSLAKASA